MKKTIILIAHPAGDQSTSQQFLVSSAHAWTDASVKLLAPLMADENRDLEEERQELLAYDRILLQFPLYWYQAPALLKDWLDWILGHSGAYGEFFKKLAGKELGIVLSIGSQAINFQPGARLGRTISDMLSPYEMLANYFGMKYLPVFLIEQFTMMPEHEKKILMMQYVYYVEKGDIVDFFAYQAYLLDLLEAFKLKKTAATQEEEVLKNLVHQHLSERAEELIELTQMNGEW